MHTSLKKTHAKIHEPGMKTLRGDIIYVKSQFLPKKSAQNRNPKSAPIHLADSLKEPTCQVP